MAFSPVSGEELILPLQYGQTVTLEPFKTKIVNYPLTSTINLQETLTKFMAHAEHLGMSRSQYVEAVKLLILTYKESYAFTFESLTEDEDIFTQACHLINPEELRTVIRQQIKLFSRKPGMSIGETFSRYYTLVHEKIKGDCPHLDSEKIKNRARRQTLLVIPDLLNPAMREVYQAWLKRRRLTGEEVGHEETLKDLQNMENSSDKYAIKEEMFPGSEVAVADGGRGGETTGGGEGDRARDLPIWCPPEGPAGWITAAAWTDTNPGEASRGEGAGEEAFASRARATKAAYRWQRRCG